MNDKQKVHYFEKIYHKQELDPVLEILINDEKENLLNEYLKYIFENKFSDLYQLHSADLYLKDSSLLKNFQVSQFLNSLIENRASIHTNFSRLLNELFESHANKTALEVLSYVQTLIELQDEFDYSYNFEEFVQLLNSVKESLSNNPDALKCISDFELNSDVIQKYFQEIADESQEIANQEESERNFNSAPQTALVFDGDQIIINEKYITSEIANLEQFKQILFNSSPAIIEGYYFFSIKSTNNLAKTLKNMGITFVESLRPTADFKVWRHGDKVKIALINNN